MDRTAQAHFTQGDYAQALAAIERRQRRSTTIASQALEARILLASGRLDAARSVADDISNAYPFNVAAGTAAAQVYAGAGDYERAYQILTGLLDARPGDVETLLTFAAITRAHGDKQLSDQMLARLGASAPPEATVGQLRRLARLHEEAGNEQRAQAVHLELQRRRHLQEEALRTALTPVIGLLQEGRDLTQIYAALNGPDQVSVSREEARKVRLSAIRHFGFSQLRPGQTEVIASVMRGESVLAVMPTGAGKSLCYQLPGLELEQATLVISPLIALMKDQVDSLPALAQSKAVFINSTLSDEEVQAHLAGVATGAYKLVYAAPERLRQRPFLHALRDAGISLFVVDEAHCVSLWGHDFRPDYLFIQEARDALGQPPALAMTATAPPQVRDEILDNLTPQTDDPSTAAGSQRPRVIALDIFRPNLHLSALEFHNEDEKLAALVKFVTETEGSGIIYANSRRKCEALALHLQGLGVSAEAYHAGLADRSGVQDRFMQDKTRVVVATIAFGMGIDKADIRFIVHFHPPRSLAAYYQEAGRAGRDGKPAQCVLFYSANDWANLRRWARADEFDIDFLERTYAAVATQLGASDALDPEKEPPPPVAGPVNLRRLQQVLAANETDVRVAISALERAGLLSRSFDVPAELEIGAPRKTGPARKLGERDPQFRRFVKKLALKPGRSAAFHTQDVAQAMGWPLLETEERLLAWQSEGAIRVQGSKREMAIYLPSRPPDMRERLQRLIEHSRAVAQRRIDDIVGYATAESCRHGYISAHFGSPPRTRCDVCDNCTGIRPEIPVIERPQHILPEDEDVEPMILDCLISLPKPVGRSGLARILTGSLRAPVAANACRHHGRLYGMGEAVVVEQIDELLERKLLRQYERHGYPVLAPTMAGRTIAEEWLAAHPEFAEPTGAGEPPEEEESEGEARPETYTALQKALYSWRRRTADELGMPAYAIMDNALMRRIAVARPQTEEELARIPGMGPQRLEKYGGVILDLVKLNPEQEGDAALLTAQEKATPRPRAKQQAPQASRASRQAERRIYLKMQELRQKIAVQERSKPYLVASNGLLKAIAKAVPQTEEELIRLPGFRSSGLRGEEEAILASIRAIVETAAG
ncbi:MAG: RecQ family ATP-dependent DNA helicase [Caldilineae bacterium]|nr:MAG: RecQ family ATP-dependent DNA helicase [Caldilineae bacterium]